MIYDASNRIDVQRALVKVQSLIDKQKKFEIKVKRPRRSISQNSYLHLILTWFAIEYGETVDYVKQVIFKQWVNEDIFSDSYTNPKTSKTRPRLKSTSELNSKELTESIERFRNWSSKEAGIYLAEPNDLASIDQMETEISKHNKSYL